jgi:hypothetical protein
MMRRIFSGYLDKCGQEADLLTDHFGCSKDEFVPVRLVSHHMRMVGVLLRSIDKDSLVLVDFDYTKR